MTTYSTTEWLRIATAGIVSPKERESARQELLDHMEDHAQAEMARGLNRSQAMVLACRAMGDPHEVGKLLRKTHQPVLTRLLQLCRVMMAAVLLFYLAYGLPVLVDFYQNRHLGQAPESYLYGTDYYVGSDASEQEILPGSDRFIVNGYTICLDRVLLRRLEAPHPNTGETASVTMLLRITAQSIWQDPPNLGYHLILTDDLGNCYLDDWAGNSNLHQARVCRRGKDTWWRIHGPLAPDAQWLELEYIFADTSFSLHCDLKEGVQP